MCQTLIDPATNASVFTFLSEFCPPWKGQTAIEVTFLALIFVVALAGNSMVIAAVIWNAKLRTVTNVLVCNLAISDMLFVAGIPFIAITRVTQHWILGEFVCKVGTYIQFVSGVCSIVTMVMISVERFMCVCLMNKYKIDMRQITLVIVVIWFIAVAYPIPVALAQTVQSIETEQDSLIFCGVEWLNDFHAEVYLGFMASFFFVIPLIVISMFYIQILRVVRRSVNRTQTANSRSERSAQKQIRLVKMFASIVILFVILWLPFFIIIFLGVHFKQITSTHFTATLILALANTCQNPLIYGYFNHRFRDEFKTMCCRRIMASACTSAFTPYGVQGTELGSIGQNSSTVE